MSASEEDHASVIVVVAIRQPSELNDAAHSWMVNKSEGRWVSEVALGVGVGVGDGDGEGEVLEEDEEESETVCCGVGDMTVLFSEFWFDD